LNDYSYRDHPDHANDSRWVHRPVADWAAYAQRSDPTSVEGQVFSGLQALTRLRKQTPAFSGGELEVIPTENEHVLGFVRKHAGQRAVIFANFSESEQVVPVRVLEQYYTTSKPRLWGSSKLPPARGNLQLKPLDLLVLGGAKARSKNHASGGA
jgi:amylosucrase